MIGAAIEVHRVLGQGFLEATYEKALSIELELRCVSHRVQVPVALTYKTKRLGDGKIDVLVENDLVVELKAVDALTPAHVRQTLTYLKATDRHLALLINFNVPRLADGIQRIAR